MRFQPAALLLVLAAGTVQAAPGTLSADIPAADVQSLTLAGGTGEMKLAPSPDDAVHVSLELEQEDVHFLRVFHWHSDTTTRDLAGAALRQERQGAALTVSLAYPSGGGHDDVKQHWTVLLPARLALATRFGAGRVQIDGIRGGVQAHLGAGDLTIHSPGGPLQAGVSAGRLHVISDDPHPGAVHLSSTFGLAVLSFNGKYYGPPERHGFMSSFHFFGNSVSQQGDGKDDITLHSSAGLVDLRVGPLGDVKDYRRLFSDDTKAGKGS